MDFTREPVIETVITPREGFKLAIRNSKGSAQEEFFVDSVEVVSFGNAFFFRSKERPKPFLVPVSDYEILEVREARMVLKHAPAEKTIKIGGGKDRSKSRDSDDKEQKAEEKGRQKEEAAAKADKEKKRERRRSRRRRSQDKEPKSEETESSTASSEPREEASGEEEIIKSPVLLAPPPLLIHEQYPKTESVEEAAQEEGAEGNAVFPGGEEIAIAPTVVDSEVRVDEPTEEPVAPTAQRVEEPEETSSETEENEAKT